MSAYFLKAFSRTAPDSCNMFSFNSHPTLPIFILHSITFGFSRDSFCTILLSDACCYPTDLCQSWRMAVLFSAWIAVLVALYVFKSSRQMCVKEVWTTQPSNPSILPLACVSQWFVMRVALIVWVYVCMCIGKPIGNNSVTVHIHVVSYSNWQIPHTFVVVIFNFGKMTSGNCCFFLLLVACAHLADMAHTGDKLNKNRLYYIIGSITIYLDKSQAFPLQDSIKELWFSTIQTWSSSHLTQYLVSIAKVILAESVYSRNCRQPKSVTHQ